MATGDWKDLLTSYDGVNITYEIGNPISITYTCDAWGRILSMTGSGVNTIGRLNSLCCRSYVYDQETGLYYLQSRYYSPQIGRFINADTFISTGQGMLGNNMFAYCRNSPVTRIDATGSFDEVCISDEGYNIFEDVGGGGAAV